MPPGYVKLSTEKACVRGRGTRRHPERTLLLPCRCCYRPSVSRSSGLVPVVGRLRASAGEDLSAGRAEAFRCLRSRHRRSNWRLRRSPRRNLTVPGSSFSPLPSFVVAMRVKTGRAAAALLAASRWRSSALMLDSVVGAQLSVRGFRFLDGEDYNVVGRFAAGGLRSGGSTAPVPSEAARPCSCQRPLRWPGGASGGHDLSWGGRQCFRHRRPARGGAAWRHWRSASPSADLGIAWIICRVRCRGEVGRQGCQGLCVGARGRFAEASRAGGQYLDMVGRPFPGDRRADAIGYQVASGRALPDDLAHAYKPRRADSGLEVRSSRGIGRADAGDFRRSGARARACPPCLLSTALHTGPSPAHGYTPDKYRLRTNRTYRAPWCWNVGRYTRRPLMKLSDSSLLWRRDHPRCGAHGARDRLEPGPGTPFRQQCLRLGIDHRGVPRRHVRSAITGGVGSPIGGRSSRFSDS